MNGTAWAAKLLATVSGPKANSEAPALPHQCLSNHAFEEKRTTLDRPKPSSAKLITIDPKCVQLPTAKIRITQICSAITALEIIPIDM
ncbi:hypothetical protein [Mesorhizobium sp. Mes31]|uniref:hypothetical protein n=1 Tax=Mesorhizobium sp. Mes31 TaxID=2926017 RepID=UPI002117E374|nr:hypothetical protein [Mesorhizobium sp. Mes31]